MLDYDARRQPHYLRQNVRSSVPTQLVFVDTETLPIADPDNPNALAHHFRLGHLLGCRIEAGKVTRKWELAFNNVSEFWSKLDSVLTERRATWLFAHSLGFDWTVLGGWQEIELGHYSFKDEVWPEDQSFPGAAKPLERWTGFLVAEDPPNIWSLRRRKCTLTCVDTRNYWRESLAALGRSVNLPKLCWDKVQQKLVESPEELDPKRFDRLPPLSEALETWQVYCQRDVEIIAKAICDLILFWQKQDLGAFRYTAAGLSWNAYRHKFMPEKSILIHGHPAIDLERAAYYGGECRCFYIGEVKSRPVATMEAIQAAQEPGSVQPVAPIYHLDINSLYPYIMGDNLFPCRLVDYLETPDPSWLAELPAQRACIVQCQILSENACYPVRLTQEGKPVLECQVDTETGSPVPVTGTTRFARGRFWTTLCHPEFLLAMAAGNVVSVGQAAIYELKDLFSSFIWHFWESRLAAKKDGRGIDASFYKLIMNSLSGKFAQRVGIWADDYDEPVFQSWGSWIHGHDAEGKGQRWRAVADHAQRYVWGHESGDSFPAISAFITSYARCYMKELRDIAGPTNVLYQDTDSLHVTKAGFELLDEQDLLEDNKLGSLRIDDIGDYARYYGLKHYRIGDDMVIGALRQQATPLSETHFEQLEFQRLPAILSSAPTGSIGAQLVDKVISLCHPDGTVAPSGWVTPTTL